MNDSLNQISSNKGQTETYALRWKDKHWWAIFYVDDAHGALSIQSDFGDFSYRWGAPGNCFKTFLTGLDDHYLMEKLSHGTNHGRYFYDMESVERLKKLVRQKCDEQGKSYEVYEDAIEEIDGYDCRDSNLFFHLAYTNDDLAGLLKEGDPHEIGDCIVTGFSPHLKQFVEKLWPGFVAVLKQELSHD